MPFFSTEQTAAVNRDNRQLAAILEGGLPQVLEDIKNDISTGNIGITAAAYDVDSLAKDGGHFAADADTTTGLTFGHRGGRFYNGRALVTVVAGTVALSASTTNYVEVSAAGVVSTNTSGFTAGRLPLYEIVTGGSSISTTTVKTPIRLIFGDGGIVGIMLSSWARTKELVIPLGTISATTSFLIISPGQAGKLAKAALTVSTAITASDTNYWTFDLMNKETGAGTTAMLVATDSNTTKATGGSGITAYVARALSLHGTAANLETEADEVLVLTATKAASAANLVNASLRLDFTSDN